MTEGIRKEMRRVSSSSKALVATIASHVVHDGEPLLLTGVCVEGAEALDAAATVQQCPPAAASLLRSVLPAGVAWRDPADVLSQLPPGTDEQQGIAILGCAPGDAVCGEDRCGAVSAHLLLHGGTVEWQVFGAAERTELAARCRGCDTASEAAAALRSIQRTSQHTVQQQGDLLLLPPCAVFVRCSRAPAALLHWLRLDAACAVAALRIDKAPVLPPLAPAPPAWRARQLAPLSRYATYLSLVRRVQGYGAAGRERDGGALSEQHEEDELLLLLRCASAVIGAETTRASVVVGLLGDNSLRACDACNAEIFNRCVRIKRPADPTPNGTAVPDDGHFCLRCVADGHVGAGAGAADGVALVQHASHEQLLEVVAVGLQLLRGSAEADALRGAAEAVLDGRSVGTRADGQRASLAMLAVERLAKPPPPPREGGGRVATKRGASAEAVAKGDKRTRSSAPCSEAEDEAQSATAANAAPRADAKVNAEAEPPPADEHDLSGLEAELSEYGPPLGVGSCGAPPGASPTGLCGKARALGELALGAPEPTVRDALASADGDLEVALKARPA